MSQILLLLCSSSLSCFSAHWEKHRRCTCLRWGTEVRWLERLCSTGTSGKTAIYGGPPKSCPDVIHSGLDWLIPGGATLHSEPFGLRVSHAKLPPKQKERAAPPSRVSTGKGSVWEPSGKSPAIQAHYRAKTSPAFHALTVDGSHKEGKPYSSKSKGSKRGDDTRLNLPLHSSWITAA